MAADRRFSIEDGEKEIKEFSDTVESVSVLRRLPEEYGCLPALYRWFFGRCLKTGSMTFAEVRFKGSDS